MLDVRRVDVLGPFGHQNTPSFEQVGATVRGLDTVAVHVRQGEFADLPRRVGAFGRPVPEAGSEAVRDGADADFAQQLRQLTIAQNAARGGREDEPASVVELSGFVEDPRGAPGKGHAVLEVRFRARGRNRPGSTLVVHLVPTRAPDFAGSAGG